MIETLSDLRKLMRALREHGVFEFEHNGTKLKLGELPQVLSQASQDEPLNPYANFPKGELTEEQLLYYSAGGLPENDPSLSNGGSL
jgi:hypothetical protein